MEKIYLKIAKDKNEQIFEEIKPILKRYTGDVPVYVYLEKQNKMIVADRSLWICDENNELVSELQDLLGQDSVKLS